MRVGPPGIERAIGQKDQEEVMNRIYPQLRSSKPGVAIGRRADEGAVQAGLLTVQLRSIPAQESRPGVRARAEKAPDCGRTHPWSPGAQTIPQPDLGISGQVHSGGKDSGMTRYAAEHGSVGIVDLALHRLASPHCGRYCLSASGSTHMVGAGG